MSTNNESHGDESWIAAEARACAEAYEKEHAEDWKTEEKRIGKEIKYKTANFIIENGNRALVRCEDCHKENYALNVLSGYCTWCGFNINE